MTRAPRLPGRRHGGGFLFVDSGRGGLAALYLAGSVAAGVLAAFIGYEAGRALG